MLAEVEKIKREVGKKYGVTIQELEGSCRDRRIIRARFEAMAMVREKTSCSLPEIGYYFGRRDHTSVLYGIRRFKKYPGWFSKKTL